MVEPRDARRIEALLRGALERPPGRNRDQWLREACGEDEFLRGRIESLVELVDGNGESAQGSSAAVLSEPVEAEGPAAVTIGSRLGPYEIVELLGVGGMGQVYRARDSKLDRDVAIKAISGAFSEDETALPRFEREARVLATLNHPNIGGIYDLRRFDGRPYLVLEFVEGETLADLMGRGPLRPERAVDIARQVAAALEEAHGKGIVHRDLKPGNVKLALGGQVKVLDFGLARRLVSGREEDASSDDTFTHEGSILGTVPYMSPEQARGQPVDERSDIWALGCLLYEMLAGRRAFRGRSASDLLVSVLRDEVDFEAVPRDVDPAVLRVLDRCLDKDPARRFQHVGDVRIELEEALRPPPTTSGSSETPPDSSMKRWLPWLVTAAACLVAVLVGIDGPAETPGQPERRFVLDVPPGTGLPRGDYCSPVTLSPDGRGLVLSAGFEEENAARLYHRTWDRLEWTELPGTLGAWQPFFSADGREVGFFAGGKLRRIALDGTAPVTVAEVGANPRGADWGPDGTIVFGPSLTSGLVSVDARGGVPRSLTSVDEANAERSHRWPQFLPGGEWILFTIDFQDRSFDEAALAVVSLTTGGRRIVLPQASYGRYLPNGHIVFARGGDLHAVPFDGREARVTGDPVRVEEGVAYDLRNGATKIAVDRVGTLAFVPSRFESDERRLVWLELDGRWRRITEEARRFHDLALSPDRRRVALRIGDPEFSDVWTLDLASRTLARVTSSLRTSRPIWTPDGTAITVGVRDEEGWRIVRLPADGQGEAVTLVQGENRLYPSAWTSDGRWLVYQERREETGWDLLTVEVDADGSPVSVAQPLVATSANETNPALSPDDLYFAYESDELEGPVDVWVRPFRRSGPKTRVSTGGGRWPQWGGPGDLFYWAPFSQSLRRIRYRIDQERFTVLEASVAWAGRGEPMVVTVSEFLGRPFDFDPETGQFLLLEGAQAQGGEESQRVVLATDWGGSLAAGEGL